MGTTVKLTPLLATPPTVTTTLPVVAPVGTGTTMLVALQLVGVAAVPLNVTVLVPCVAPKFVPVIVTDVPTGPEVGDRLPIAGATDASWYSSALESGEPSLSEPPAIRTIPLFSNVALWDSRATFKLPVKVKAPVEGLYIAALELTAPEVPGRPTKPPAINTIPLLSSVAAWCSTPPCRLPVTAKVPVETLYNSALERGARGLPLSPPMIKTI